MAARAAEPIVEIEVAECGVEVVAPHQAHDAPAEQRIPGFRPGR